MSERTNEWGQPIGRSLGEWTAPPAPQRPVLAGRCGRVEPLDVERHAEALYRANSQDEEGRSWTYLAYGPFATLESYRDWMAADCLGDDPQFYAIVDERDDAVGVASYLNIDAASGSVEVGHIHFSPHLQRTVLATEAMYLMMRYAFELGYRRYEWKCDSLNAASRAAAQRLGLSFEGIFRQAKVYKGRNRDTAWYAAIDAEWPALQQAFEVWLAPGNFDAQGQQKQRLSELTKAALQGG